MIGIYKITNPKGKVYIGQSVNIEKRWNHYKRLECRLQKKIYNSFLKYGVDKHNFEVIQLCDINQLDELEKYYVDLFQTFNNKNGLNLKDGGGARGKLSEESKLKMSKSLMGHIKSLETRKKISDAGKGRKLSIEHKKKLYDSHKGIKRSDDLKYKMSEIKKKIILDTSIGIFYNGVEEAALIYRVKRFSLQKMLNGFQKNKTNLIYV